MSKLYLTFFYVDIICFWFCCFCWFNCYSSEVGYP